jgi:uncharacterized membrane protein
MGFFRRAALTSLYSLLSITLFSFGVLFSLKMVFGQPKPLEKALDQSGIYSSLVQNVVNQNASNSNLPLKQPEIQAAAQKAFPPTLLKQSTDQLLDGTYAWLQGKTTTPQFSIDLSPAKTQFANYVGDYTQQRLDSLPACTLANMPTSLTNLNPFDLTCLPPGASKTAIVQQSKEQVLANTDILSQTLYTPDTLKNDTGKTLTQQLQAIPQAYHRMMLGIYLTGFVALAAIAGILLLHPSRRAGVRRVAITALSVGLVSGLMAFLGSFVLRQAADSLTHSSQTTELVQTKLVTVLHLLADDLRTWWLGYGVLLVAISVGIWVVLRLVKPKQPVASPPLPQSPPPPTSTN